MFRPPSYGGLGLHNVQWKSTAGLIKTFLETACNPKYQTSLFHSLLYRYHVLEDHSVPNPGFPPYYNRDFFSIIRKVHRETPLNVSQMSEKQWYTYLVEENVTMQTTGDSESRNYIPCNAELKSPTTEWEESWRLASLRGLGPEYRSFLFKLLHGTLVTQENLSKTNRNISSLCKFQGCPGTMVEDLGHALVHCGGNNGAGQAVWDCIQIHVPGLQVHEALHLELKVDKSLELPIVFTLAVAWSAIWELRLKKIRPQPYLIRAELEARISLLRECRHLTNEVAVLNNIFETL